MHVKRPVRLFGAALLVAGLLAVVGPRAGAQAGEYYYRLVPTTFVGSCWYIPANTPVWNETGTDIWNLSFEAEEEWNYPPDSDVVLSVFAPPGNLIFSEPWTVLDPDGDSGSDLSGTGAQIPAPEVSEPYDAIFRMELFVEGVLAYWAEVTFVGVEACNQQGAGPSVDPTPIPLTFVEWWPGEDPVDPVDPDEPIDPDRAAEADQGATGAATPIATPVTATPRLTG